MKATERRLIEEKDKLSSEILKIKKRIEEKESEKNRALLCAKDDCDQRVGPFILSLSLEGLFLGTSNLTYPENKNSSN